MPQQVLKLPRPFISRVPRGFLGLLDIKSGGKAPPDFADVVAPTLDLTHMYYDSARIFEARGINVIVAGVQAFDNVAATTVPQNEVWIVTDLALVVVAGAIGDIFNGNVIYQTSGLVNNPRLAATFRFSTAAAIAIGRQFHQPGLPTFAAPIVMPPGSQFLLSAEAITGAAQSATLTWGSIRLSI